MPRYAIGLGSNAGDRVQHMVGAVEELSRSLGQVEVSAVYETEPVGGPDQGAFLNAAVTVSTEMGPLEVLGVCQEIEKSHGRERKERWGPRTLDLDILASDGPRHDDDRLTIPHPRAMEREFVLRPLCDIWPDAPVGEDLTAAAALRRVEYQGVDHLSDDWVPPVSRWKASALLAGQFALFAAIAVLLATTGRLPEGGIGPVGIVGGALVTAGVVLALSASRSLGSSMAASPIPRVGGELVIAGPYRFARHPIYGGLILLFIGAGLFLESAPGVIVAAVLIPYFMLKARYEERQLRLRYPGYLPYRQAVRKWLIPFVV